MKTFCLPVLFAAGMAAVSFSSAAAEIAYIASSSGYVLHNSGNIAVTANWTGQLPMQGYAGFGPIKMNGTCLTGRTGSKPLTWERCRGDDKSQVWALSNNRLNNENGWCADVEGNRNGAGVQVLANTCSGAANQRWKAHSIESAHDTASRISDQTVRSTFLQTALAARAGQVISLSTGRLVASSGGNLVASGGGNVVAAGTGNLVLAGSGI